jgi:hypothetical protein
MLTVVLDRFGGVDALSAESRPLPEPGPDEIRIRVRAVGFNPVDSKLRQGVLGGVPPMVLGRDVSGVVDAVGADVAGFAAGDPVYARADAAYAESVLVPAALAGHAVARHQRARRVGHGHLGREARVGQPGEAEDGARALDGRRRVVCPGPARRGRVPGGGQLRGSVGRGRLRDGRAGRGDRQDDDDARDAVRARRARTA